MGKNAEEYSGDGIVEKRIKNPHDLAADNHNRHVDNVDNYFPSRASPISTTFPAPIVINKSPFMQCFNKNLSISSKDGK